MDSREKLHGDLDHYSRGIPGVVSARGLVHETSAGAWTGHGGHVADSGWRCSGLLKVGATEAHGGRLEKRAW